MFFCRDIELQTLNQRYNGDDFECIIIYGRRRVGKTALINEFCKNKPVIFFSALNASAQENLDALSASIYQYKNSDYGSSPVFRNFEDAFMEITRLSQQQRLIFVIDEYPYLARADKSVSSRLQHIIDHVWQNSRIYLILCGSSMSFMEYQVLGYESPLYGRRTAQMKIQPLTYRESAEFYPQLNLEDQSLLYGITGGIPHYINKMNITDTIDEALLQNLFHTSGYLFEEPENLLKQELREPAVYNSIIIAIAGGASRANEISTKTGLESGACAKYLQVLLKLGILKKETPVSEKSGKKTIYRIEDNFFRFWYRFVPKNMSLISSGRFPAVYEKAVKQYFPDYMGLIFEKMCRDFLVRYADGSSVVYQEIGQWWGTDPKTHKQIQIDIVGLPLEGSEYLIGSCKYKNTRVGTDELALLTEYAHVFRREGTFRYCIFSKGGFTEALLQSEKEGKVTLYTLEDLYGI